MVIIWPQLLSTALGGAIAASATVLPQWHRNRLNVKRAIRMWRDDLYSNQNKLARALATRSWWPDTLECPALATDDDVGAVAAKLSGEAWKHLSGARRRFLALQYARSAWIRDPESGSPPDPKELWDVYDLMDGARKALHRYDKDMKYFHHDDYTDAERAIAAWSSDATRTAGEPLAADTER